MHKLAAKIKSGTVWGNCHSMIDPALPFGGYKQSGLGREQARQGVEAYTELKTRHHRACNRHSSESWNLFALRKVSGRFRLAPE